MIYDQSERGGGGGETGGRREGSEDKERGEGETQIRDSTRRLLFITHSYIEEREEKGREFSI